MLEEIKAELQKLRAGLTDDRSDMEKLQAMRADLNVLIDAVAAHAASGTIVGPSTPNPGPPESPQAP